MPAKGGKRAGRARGKRAEFSDDESSNDAASITSGQSDNKSLVADENDNNNVDELSQQEIFEEKLKETIDGLTQKCANSRVQCFQQVEKIFAHKHLPDFVEDRKMTLSDAIEKGLKKGGNEEIASAARLSTSLCIQLGDCDSSEIIAKDLKSSLIFIANDKAVSCSARAQCCWALTMNHFITSNNDNNETMQLMILLSNIFSASCLKGNGVEPTISADQAMLHSSALAAWTVLLTIISPSTLINYLTTSKTSTTPLERLGELLETSHLDIRLTAGEALAVIFEIGREYEVDFDEDWAYDLVFTIRALATDSNKYRGKKDRKLQRASFREILAYIENGDMPDGNVKFGNETFFIEKWCQRVHYNAFCRLLGPGINTQLSDNMLLRDVFQLGSRVVLLPNAQKTTKRERAMKNAAAFKARTIQRNKNRDKRSVAMAQ